jgi:hypothetical protein
MHLRDLTPFLGRPWFIMNKPRYIQREEFLASCD